MRMRPQITTNFEGGAVFNFWQKKFRDRSDEDQAIFCRQKVTDRLMLLRKDKSAKNIALGPGETVGVA